MRMLIVVIAALSSAAVLAPAPGRELHGSVVIDGRHQPNAVIWLEASGAPVLPSPRKAVLDQRNLAFSPRVLAVRVKPTRSTPPIHTTAARG
jgi:hypothetical protein